VIELVIISTKCHIRFSSYFYVRLQDSHRRIPRSPINMSTSTEPNDTRTQLDHLRRQRAYKRGLVTKAQGKIKSLSESHPDNWDPATIEELTEELYGAVRSHDDLQSQIDELLFEDATAYELEQTALEEHNERHSGLRLNLKRIQQQHTLWNESHSVVNAMSRLSSTTDKTTDRFSTKLDEFTTNCDKLFNAPTTIRSHPAIKERLKSLQDGIEKFSQIVDTAASTASTISTPSSPTRSTHHDRPRMAPIHLDIPKFQGDPLQWEAFEMSLNSLLKHRADGFSEPDKFAIVRQAIVPPQGKALIADRLKQGATCDKLLKDLRHMFGRPQLVIPTLVKKVTEPPRVDQSAAALRRFKEQVLDNYRSLHKQVKGDLGLFFPHFLRSFLDGKLREDWERLLFEKLSEPSMDDFVAFIEQRLLWADTQVTIPTTPLPAKSAPSPSPQPQRQKTPTTPAKCASCGEAHWLGRCQTFAALGTEERNRLVREKKLCLNCFSPTHPVRNCTNRHTCRSCAQKHHTLLHRESRPTTTIPATPTPTTTPTTVASVDTPADVTPPQPISSVTGYFTCTVVARLQNQDKVIKARLLMDHGSGGCFITEELASLLKLTRHAQDRLFTGFGQGSVRSKFYVTTKLMSTTSTFETDPIQLSVIPKPFQTSTSANRDTVLSRASELGLSLSDTMLGGKVDVILGGEFPWDLCGETIVDHPYRFISTKFGYGAVGPLSASPSVLTIAEQDSTLKEDLEKLWALDRVAEASTLNTNEQHAMDSFNETTKMVDGRIQVSLPFKQDAPPLGDSRKQALCRFFRNEESLSRKGLLSPFSEALSEYLQLGHAHVIPQEEIYTTSPTYYMPVHGVFKSSSTTTKVRPVFDASAPTTSGYSLNDCLHIGPNLYPQLADVLLQFRRHPVGLSADISKMFREIRLDPKHQDYHRFLLRHEGKLTDCRMERVTFGVASSPFLATQTLRFLATTFEDEYPRAAELIRTVFYVDDFVSGADSVQDAADIRQELCGLLSRGGMVLRKWRSNSASFLEDTPPSLREIEPSPLCLQESPKALGAHWDTTSDMLHISIPELPSPEHAGTKRLVASISASVFDVMGLFAPTTIIPRMLLQETWKLQLHWDKPLPENLAQTWSSWTQDIHHIREHSIPRQFFPNSGPLLFKSLHGFSDASEKAYGAAIYLRAVTSEGSVVTSLVTAKSRVLPTKHVTIPKAELLGAHLLSRLLTHTAQLLGVSPDNLHTWTDSSIVLHWLSKDSSQVRDRFVANRIQVCHDLLPHTRWKHVRSQDNPADLASRGVSASDLVNSSLWWAGPRWLSESPDGWPVLRLTRPPEAVQVLSISPSYAVEPTRSQFLNDLWSRFSSIHTLERVVAWIYRFYSRLKDKVSLTSTILTPDELRTSHKKLIRLSQLQDFPEVLGAISQDKPLSTSHPLSSYLPILKDKIIYLRSRVRDHKINSSPKLLIPLHSKSIYTKLLLKTSHVCHLHPGVAALHSIIGDKYYIAGLRNLLKHISRSCPSCQRAYARPLSHQLGMLPTVRTTPAPPFMKVGVDFAGPLNIRRGHTRRPVTDKCYVAVFTCMATKAVHLDLCASLSTEDFLATLTRFVSRRGCPSDIYSDNGSNFVGAREEIRELEALLGSRESRQSTSHFAQRNGIRWHNIPPRAPHFGGLWEAAVKTMKTLLKKNLTPHLLRFDELYTLLTEAESILNSRPLTPIRQDEVSQGLVITAGHFLIGRPLRAPPTQEPPSGIITSLRRWRLVARLKDDLWKMWLKSYLQSQQDRNKWIKEQEPLKVDDLVYIKDETLRNRAWPIAKVIHTYPGDDGQVRAAKLLCNGNSYVRATKMLVKLFPETDENQSTSESCSDTR